MLWSHNANEIDSTGFKHDIHAQIELGSYPGWIAEDDDLPAGQLRVVACPEHLESCPDGGP